MFIHYNMAGPSPTEGVIMLLPIIAGGAGIYIYEMSSLIIHA